MNTYIQQTKKCNQKILHNWNGPQACINQLGGEFFNGMPLNDEVRQKIVKMAAEGTRTIDISSELKVTQRCVQKILKRYRETGSIHPGVSGGYRPRFITPEIERRIEEYKRSNPRIFSSEIRDKLIRDGICDRTTAPPISVILRLLCDREANVDSDEQQQNSNSQEDNSVCESSSGITLNFRKRRRRTPYSPMQLKELKNAFDRTQYPNMNTRKELAQRTDLSEGHIQVWFSNRRALLRKQHTCASAASIANQVPAMAGIPSSYAAVHTHQVPYAAMLPPFASIAAAANQQRIYGFYTGHSSSTAAASTDNISPAAREECFYPF